MRPPYIPKPTKTSKNMDIHVDDSAGSDVTGDGSAASPYASVKRAYRDVPEHIDHRVRILIHGGGAEFPEDVSPHFGEEAATLAFIGVGAEEEVVSVMTLTGDSALGTGAGHSYTVAGSAWAPEEYAGAWLLPTNGAAEGHAIPILNNDADTLYCPYRDPIPATGDDVRIVRPSVACNVRNTAIRALGSPAWDTSWNYSRIGLLNLRLEHGSAISTLDYAEGVIVSSFVQHLLDDGAYEPITVRGGASINGAKLLDTGAAAEASAAVDNIKMAGFWDGAGVSARRVTAGHATTGSFCVWPRGESASIKFATALDFFSTYGPARSSANGWGRVGTEQFYTESHSLVDGMGSNDGVTAYSIMEMALSQVYIRDANYGIQVGSGDVSLNSVECDPAVMQYGIQVGANTTVRCSSNPAGLTGTVNDIEFSAPAPNTNAAWPAVGAQVTDGLGASVVRTA